MIQWGKIISSAHVSHFYSHIMRKQQNVLERGGGLELGGKRRREMEGEGKKRKEREEKCRKIEGGGGCMLDE